MYFDVTLGIDRACVDTHRRMKVRVLAGDRLSAALVAENIGDNQVREPAVEYTHAINVRPVWSKLIPRPAGMALPLPMAA